MFLAVERSTVSSDERTDALEGNLEFLSSHESDSFLEFVHIYYMHLNKREHLVTASPGVHLPLTITA